MWHARQQLGEFCSPNLKAPSRLGTLGRAMECPRSGPYTNLLGAANNFQFSAVKHSRWPKCVGSPALAYRSRRVDEDSLRLARTQTARLRPLSMMIRRRFGGPASPNLHRAKGCTPVLRVDSDGESLDISEADGRRRALIRSLTFVAANGS